MPTRKTSSKPKRKPPQRPKDNTWRKRSDFTPKEWRFVQEYPVDLNATQAAIRAGYSEKTAGQAGCRLLTNVKIQRALYERFRELSKGIQITSEMVLAGMHREAIGIGPDTNTGARVSAWHHLGKKTGDFSDKHLHYHKNIDDMTEDELRIFLGMETGE